MKTFLLALLLVVATSAYAKVKYPVTIVDPKTGAAIGRFLYIEPIGDAIVLVDKKGSDVGGVAIRETTGEMQPFYVELDGTMIMLPNKKNPMLKKGAKLLVSAKKDGVHKAPVVFYLEETGEVVARVDRIPPMGNAIVLAEKDNQVRGLFISDRDESFNSFINENSPKKMKKTHVIFIYSKKSALASPKGKPKVKLNLGG